MSRWRWTFQTLLLISLLGFPARLPAADPIVAATVEEAEKDPDFLLQGEYVGENVGFQVVALGDHQFQIAKLPGGLPGAGWTGKDRTVVEDDADALRALIEAQKLKRTDRKSPTLGEKPPADATVLFDGTQKTLDEQWQSGAKMTADGLLIQGATSKSTFGDYSLHIEFELPYMPAARGQGRGNSGVYYQGRYETQVLDSFGLEGKNNECGGLYTIRDPDVNMCLPPLTWQTYDCDFTAARWDADGKKTRNARITVKLNGVVVHQDAELPNITTAAPVQESPAPGPVYLQDHGNPVRYRNIWVVPRDAQKEALRPVVPSYERFLAGRQGDAAKAGGLLLATELGCVNCHAADAKTPVTLNHRPAPILDGLGQRARPEWVAKFVAAPHDVKPGTLMPDVFAGIGAEQRAHEVQAIVSYLTAGSAFSDKPGDRTASQRGYELYSEIGCVACHEPRGSDGMPLATVNAAATIPLPSFREKYSISSLARFLKDPHRVRASGRMPSFNLEDKEARDLACFLVGDPVSQGEPNVQFAAFHGNWDHIPDFDQMQPAKAGKCRGLDLTVAGRDNDFGVTFQAFWKAETAGRYRFYLGSDDGSKLWVDNKEVVDADGVHPHSENSKSVRLEAGVHHIRVDYFQGGGEWTLTLEVESANEPRQPIESLLYFSRAEAENPPPKPRPEGLQAFDNDPALRAEGKELFQSRGCAACHQLKVDGNALASTRSAKPFAELEPGRGCLAASLPTTSTTAPLAPDFGLTSSQQAALTAALSAVKTGDGVDRGDLIAATMSSFNCYACHKRGDVGSPERDRDALFITTILEMGDEGRIPPPLNGVGDKLNADWLKHVLAEGAKDRPYMKTKMPRFGSLPVDELTKAFAEADQHETAPEIPALDEPAYRTKATGRKLAGNNGLACVKCHVFGNLPATGIQSIDLRKLTRRVREDWFDRYLVNPQKYRPGTRMPTSFVNGTSAVATIYDGHPGEQMKSLWMYLSDGDQAGIPEGVQGETIELIPTDSPILYRNFLAGLSQRGIAVGYPEKAHLAWDAEKMCLALVWHGRFIDAGMHWNGRGQGAQSPLGDHVMRIDETTPIAKLASGDSEWPKALPREHGYAFRGYKLNAKQQPSFQYDLLEQPAEKTPAGSPPKTLVHITDFPEPAPDLAPSSDPGIRRTITLTADEAVDGLYFRAATGSKFEPVAQEPGTYLIDGERRIRLRTAPGAEAFVRESAGKKELIVPLSFQDGRCELVEEIMW